MASFLQYRKCIKIVISYKNCAFNKQETGTNYHKFKPVMNVNNKYLNLKLQIAAQQVIGTLVSVAIRQMLEKFIERNNKFTVVGTKELCE